MAKKKGKRPEPVHPPKGDPNKIVIRPEDLPKERGCPIPPTQSCNTRKDRIHAVRRGSRRHPKHRGGDNV
jgi:hypothetical protein